MQGAILAKGGQRYLFARVHSLQLLALLTAKPHSLAAISLPHFTSMTQLEPATTMVSREPDTRGPDSKKNDVSG